ncbi:hypothetical protein LCGC14_2763530, partial [marine sediment metagenome]
MIERINCEKYLLNWKKKAEFAYLFALVNVILAFFSLFGIFFHNAVVTSTIFTPLARILFIFAGSIFSLGTIEYIRAIIIFSNLYKVFEKEDLKQDDLAEVEENWNKLILQAKVVTSIGFLFMLLSL